MDTTRPPEKKDRDLDSPRRRHADERSRPGREAKVAAPPGHWDHETESFGAWLSRHRLVRGIELREIAEDSKIGMTYLRAFEDDRFDLLPAPVFAKGFLRQYANYVGLDPEEVVNFYLSALGGHESGEESAEPATDRVRPEPAKLVGWVLGLALLAWLVWFVAVGRGDRTTDEGEAVEGPGLEAPVAATEPAPSVVDVAAGDAADVQAGDVQTADVQAPEVQRSADPVAVPPEDVAPLLLTLDFSGECWVEVAIDGERRVAENKIQGESLVLRADQSIDVKIGDVNVVEAELNGRPFRFEGSSATRVRNQRIDLDTITAFGDS